ALRLFSVAHNPSLVPDSDVKGQWNACSPQTIGNFSAVAYFFGRELHRELEVPIGLLHSSVGGTPAEAWTRLEALKTRPALAERAEQEIAQFQSQDDDNRKFVGERAAWEEKYGVQPPPISDAARGWAEPGLDTSDWKPVTLPAPWRSLGANSGGVFWLRKEFSLPEALAGKPLWLSLDWVSEQYDTVFFNGVEIGRANDKPPGFYMVQRGYPVPAKLVQAGRAIVAVRVVSATQNAGVSQRGRNVFPFANLANVDDNWLLKTEATFAPLPADALAARPKPNNIVFRTVSAALYNGMIAPLCPFAIKGAIWYQGESNTTRSGEYGDLLSLMIRDWREQWNAGDFPFYIVQLANYYGVPKEPGKRSGVAEVREQQLKVSQRVPNCGLAVAIDIGEEGIHPRNKQDVGKRLALQALAHTYGRSMPCSGPIYRTMNVDRQTVRVIFDHAEGGLVAKGGALNWFAIAGADKKFVWADAKIDGDTVVVSSPQVPQPVAVRYAWADNPAGCNLYNQAGLPATPFRTDDWQ
ncbi:MAG: 9-O-acetylesterase, partial [Planctomycetota bacterium]|nr:9-O-acetylesterase [Planctomycetota bacterium]